MSKQHWALVPSMFALEILVVHLFHMSYCVLRVLSGTLVLRCMMFIFCVKEVDWGMMVLIALGLGWAGLGGRAFFGVRLSFFDCFLGFKFVRPIVLHKSQGMVCGCRWHSHGVLGYREVQNTFPSLLGSRTSRQHNWLAFCMLFGCCCRCFVTSPHTATSLPFESVFWSAAWPQRLGYWRARYTVENTLYELCSRK